MKIKKNNRNKNKTFAFLTLTILCISSLYLAVEFYTIPNKIQFIEGTQSELMFNLPISATFEAENCQTLKVNNTAVTDNITIDMRQTNTFDATESGKGLMTLNAFGVPIKKVIVDVVAQTEIMPCGMAVGVKINTKGVMVIGTGEVVDVEGQTQKPSDGILKSGDLIVSANSHDLSSKEQFGEIVKSSKDVIKLKIERENETIETEIQPVLGNKNEDSKLGVYVRDGTQGIGTITYYNPKTNHFAALGHAILDVDTKQIMTIRNGDVREADIVSVTKGRKGAPGELIGETEGNFSIGKVEKNSAFGIFGSIDIMANAKMPKEKYPVGLSNEIHEGPATIFSTVEGTQRKEYDVYIEAVNRNTKDDSRGMVVRITDPELISTTGGIVQGMSGSPIIQDGKIIGAVTHVFVNDPTKGYGIFIENMLNQEASM